MPLYQVNGGWRYDTEKSPRGAYAYEHALAQMRAIKNSQYRRAHGTDLSTRDESKT